ncbi:13387_t:CDS:2, partial [Funneliformis caledonium]
MKLNTLILLSVILGTTTFQEANSAPVAEDECINYHYIKYYNKYDDDYHYDKKFKHRAYDYKHRYKYKREALPSTYYKHYYHVHTSNVE